MASMVIPKQKGRKSPQIGHVQEGIMGTAVSAVLLGPATADIGQQEELSNDVR